MFDFLIVLRKIEVVMYVFWDGFIKIIKGDVSLL